MLSKDASAEPRFQINDTAGTQAIFGVDVEGWVPGRDVTVDAGALGYPVNGLADLPAGTYALQALFHRYETFTRSDGHVVKLPMDRGEGQQWNRAPGNLYSTPASIQFGWTPDGTYSATLDQVIPAIAPPQDTRYIKHERIQSDLLSRFWGRPDAPRRARAAARRLGHAPRGALPGGHQPRSLLLDDGRLPRGAAGRRT